MSRPVCFVVMGFGEKTDFATGRTLNLDKTYRSIIKKAVEEAGLECVRADNIIHSGVIDKPMYEMLLKADIVIADLSTSNPNAIYELGVRHALRPYTTIVIAESLFKFPFDIQSLLIRKYEHLGKGIDAEEAERMKDELKATIQVLLKKQQTDSPVHTFLTDLTDTKVSDKKEDMFQAQNSSVRISNDLVQVDMETTELMELFVQARADSDWKMAVQYLRKLLEKRSGDVYLIQQLALAAYKSKIPDSETALLEAHRLLQQLDPRQTTDPETLGLWGAVHKRLWEIKGDRAALDEAIWAYEKGFYIKNDYYNGINFAYSLNVRASISPPREAIADTVIAERVRRQIIQICEALLKNGIKDDEGEVDHEQLFWVRATVVEALIGIGEKQKAEEMKRIALEGYPEIQKSTTTDTFRLLQRKPEAWMVESLNEQLAKLEHLLAMAPVLK